MADVTITPRKNGPYMVQGPLKLVDPAGNEFTVEETSSSSAAAASPRTSPSATATTAPAASRPTPAQARTQARAILEVPSPLMGEG